MFPEENHKLNVEISRQFGWKLRRQASTEEMAEIIAALLFKRNDRFQVLERAKTYIENEDRHT